MRMLAPASLVVCLGMIGCGSMATKPSVAPTVHTTGAMPAEDVANAPSCVGVREHVAGKAFFSRDSVLAVERVQQRHYVGSRSFVWRPAGAEILVAAEPGKHKEFLERLARCHMDTYAQTGHSPGDDPLGVPGADYDIHRVNGGYAIRVTADNWDAAREIQERAERLER